MRQLTAAKGSSGRRSSFEILLCRDMAIDQADLPSKYHFYGDVPVYLGSTVWYPGIGDIPLSKLWANNGLFGWGAFIVHLWGKPQGREDCDGSRGGHTYAAIPRWLIRMADLQHFKHVVYTFWPRLHNQSLKLCALFPEPTWLGLGGKKHVFHRW